MQCSLRYYLYLHTNTSLHVQGESVENARATFIIIQFQNIY